MAGRHEFEASGLNIDPSVKDLGLTKHPVAIAKKHDRREFKNSDGVLGESIIKGLWQLVVVSHLVPLQSPENGH